MQTWKNHHLVIERQDTLEGEMLLRKRLPYIQRAALLNSYLQASAVYTNRAITNMINTNTNRD